MRKLLLPFFLFITLNIFASESIIRQLSEVNNEWKNQIDGQLLATTTEVSNNKTFNDWIATHLMLVEKTLRQRSTKELNSSQKQNRFMLLDELNIYWHNRAFPVNDYLSYKNPIFIDRNNNYCAVGYLMKQSGAASLAKAIDRDNKFVYVKEIKTKGVSEWANENGFTIDELAWIQPGYPVTFTVNDFSEGLNGSVNCMITTSSSPSMYVGGSFTSSTKGVTCNGVAAYISGIAGWDWISLGNGVNGTVNAMLLLNDKLYVGGKFTMAGTVPASNIAVYDLISGQWNSMGSLDSTVNSLAVFQNEIYAGGNFTGFVSKWTSSQWQDVTSGFLSGEGVRTLEDWNNILMIGGNFELATGALRRHVATYDGINMGASGFGTITPVNDFEIYRDTLYAACDFINGIDTCALARFSNFDWEVILKPHQAMMDLVTGTSIRHLLTADDALFCAGNFFTTSGLYFGQNLMSFSLINGQVHLNPLLMIDNTIQTMGVLGNTLCFAGDFVTAGTDSLNHIGEFSNWFLGVNNNHIESSDAFDVYPNPARNKFYVHFKDISNYKDCYFKILDVNGREVFRQEITESLFSIDLSLNNAKGIYIMQVMNGDGVIDKKKIVMM